MFIYYFLSIIILVAVATIGFFYASKGFRDWYPNLKLPLNAPALSYISIASSIIYLLSFMAIFILWTNPDSYGNQLLVTVLMLNAILNTLWVYMFFERHNLFYSFIEIIFLLLSVIACILAFLPFSPLSSILFIPYALCVAYTGSINFKLARLN